MVFYLDIVAAAWDFVTPFGFFFLGQMGIESLLDIAESFFTWRAVNGYVLTFFFIYVCEGLLNRVWWWIVLNLRILWVKMRDYFFSAGARLLLLWESFAADIAFARFLTFRVPLFLSTTFHNFLLLHHLGMNSPPVFPALVVFNLISALGLTFFFARKMIYYFLWNNKKFQAPGGEDFKMLYGLNFMGSLVGALIGWDGLGITSFLLVIYYKNRKSLGSGMITALTNRLGDCFFLLLLGIFFYINSYHYIFCLLLIFTSITKRAQVPFSSWLPSAMAAPTPVRALVHSSTLVTAGVYLLLRFNIFTMEWILLFGRMTMLIAGVRACLEIDLKKIVALSTLSQLGVMMISLSVFQKNICFFHLVTHAIFKALLFMCVGVAIHTVYGGQDFRSFSNLGKNINYPIRFLTISNISLLGFPFMSGFYRKDIIIERFYSSYSCYLGGIFFLIGVGLTAAYRIKIINLACINNISSLPSVLGSGGLRWQVKGPLSLLGICSVLRGFLIGYNMSLSVVVYQLDKIMPLVLIRLGLIRGLLLADFKDKNFSSILRLRPLFQKSRNFARGAGVIKVVDYGFVEEFGGPGVLKVLANFFFSLHPLVAVSLIVLVGGI